MKQSIQIIDRSNRLNSQLPNMHIYIVIQSDIIFNFCRISATCTTYFHWYWPWLWHLQSRNWGSSFESGHTRTSYNLQHCIHILLDFFEASKALTTPNKVPGNYSMIVWLTWCVLNYSSGGMAHWCAYH